MGKLWKINLFLAVVLLMNSCYTQKIVLNADRKSGKMFIEYSFDDDDFEIVSLVLSSVPSGDGGVLDPSILIDQDEFQKFISSSDSQGLKTEKVSITRKNVGSIGVYTGSIVLAFDNFETLLTRLPAGENGFALTKEANTIKLEQKLEMDKMGDMETLDNYLEMVKTDKSVWYQKFINSVFTMQVILKTPFLDSKGIAISPDKKTATYTFKTSDMIGANRKNLDFMLKF